MILFFSLVAFFLLVSPLTIFYSQGYRFDFKERKITQTGGLFLTVKPKRAQIYLEGRLKKETDLLFGSALIENLMPGNYRLTVKKEGFQPWKKNLAIEEKMVTEAKNILLLPEELVFEPLTDGVKEIFFSPDKTKAIFLTEETDSIAKEKKEVLKLYNLERRIKSHLLEEDDFREEEIAFLNLVWAPDGQRILLEMASQEQVKYFLLDLSPPLRLTPLDFLPQDVLEIHFHPQDSQRVFLIKPQLAGRGLNNLFAASLAEEEVSPLPLFSGFVSATLSEQNHYWLSPDGFLYQADLSGKGEERLNDSALDLPQGEVAYRIFLEGERNVFLQAGADLFWLDPENRAGEKIFDNVKTSQPSPDKKKLALLKDHEIWLYFLEKEFSPSSRERGEKVFLTRFIGEIEEISWLNAHYLFFKVGDEIKVIETDERDKAQVWPLAAFKDAEMFFDRAAQTLYILSEGRLFAASL